MSFGPGENSRLGPVGCTDMANRCAVWLGLVLLGTLESVPPEEAVLMFS